MTTPAASERQAIDVAAYVWPSYTGDEPRPADVFLGREGRWAGIGESGSKK